MPNAWGFGGVRDTLLAGKTHGVTLPISVVACVTSGIFLMQPELILITLMQRRLLCGCVEYKNGDQHFKVETQDSP